MFKKILTKNNQSGFTLIEVLVSGLMILIVIGGVVGTLSQFRVTTTTAYNKHHLDSLDSGLANYIYLMGNPEYRARLLTHGSSHPNPSLRVNLQLENCLSACATQCGTRDTTTGLHGPYDFSIVDTVVDIPTPYYAAKLSSPWSSRTISGTGASKPLVPYKNGMLCTNATNLWEDMTSPTPPPECILAQVTRFWVKCEARKELIMGGYYEQSGKDVDGPNASMILVEYEVIIRPDKTSLTPPGFTLNGPHKISIPIPTP